MASNWKLLVSKGHRPLISIIYNYRISKRVKNGFIFLFVWKSLINLRAWFDGGRKGWLGANERTTIQMNEVFLSDAWWRMNSTRGDATHKITWHIFSSTPLRSRCTCWCLSCRASRSRAREGRPGWGRTTASRSTAAPAKKQARSDPRFSHVSFISYSAVTMLELSWICPNQTIENPWIVGFWPEIYSRFGKISFWLWRW